MMTNSALIWVGRIWLGLILFFLYAPIIVMAFMSFNASPYYQLPFEFSLTWYDQLGRNTEILQAAIRSVLIALATTVIATILGTAAALALFRFEFRGKRVL
ncbi:MAG: ABC transporter permease, partial [Pseudomonadota bacterium]